MRTMTTANSPHMDAAIAAALVTALRTPEPKEASIARARAEIAEGHGTALFSALFDQHRRESADVAIIAVGGTMQTLERLWPHAPDISGYLMARLYPVASRYKDHDTYDAIALWMDSSSSAALAEALVLLVGEGLRPKLRARYAAWAASIHQRAGRST